MIWVHVVIFLFMQVIANLLFKWGSTASSYYWWGFILGNLMGVSSIFFMICMHKAMPAALVIAVGFGGTFLLNQIAMYLIYREPLSSWASCGLVLIFIGILMTALLNKPQPEQKTAEAILTVKASQQQEEQ